MAVADFIAYKGECTGSVLPDDTEVEVEVVTFDMTSDPTTSPSPAVKPTVPEATPTADSPDPKDTSAQTDPVDALSEPSSASAAVVGTASVLAVSAFIFVAV